MDRGYAEHAKPRLFLPIRKNYSDKTENIETFL